jgi:hypothetical protein
VRKCFESIDVVGWWGLALPCGVQLRHVSRGGTKKSAMPPPSQSCRVRSRVVVVVRYAPAFPRRQRNANGQSVRRHGTARSMWRIGRDAAAVPGTPWLPFRAARSHRTSQVFVCSRARGTCQSSLYCTYSILDSSKRGWRAGMSCTVCHWPRSSPLVHFDKTGLWPNYCWYVLFHKTDHSRSTWSHGSVRSCGASWNQSFKTEPTSEPVRWLAQWFSASIAGLTGSRLTKPHQV